jgi:hypothetical protein
LSLPSYAGRATLFLAERMFWRRRDDEARAAFETARQLSVAGGDRLGEAMARCYLVRLGADDDGLGLLVEDLDLPSVRTNWLLARAGRDLAPADAADRFETLMENADLSLSLLLRAMAWMDRPASARALVRAIAERLQSRSVRRRFLAQWQAGARI